MQDVRRTAAQWLFHELWDFDRVPDPEAMEVYAKALMACANGDGTLAPAERDWVVGFGAAVGFPEPFLEEMKRYAADDDPAELVRQTDVTNAPAVRLSIVYDAVRACGADGEVSGGELTAVYEMAEAMGMARDRVDAVVAQYHEEQRVRQQRLQLIYGEDGKPY